MKYFGISKERQEQFELLKTKFRYRADIYSLGERYGFRSLSRFICIDVSKIEGCHYGLNNVFVPIIERLEERGVRIGRVRFPVRPDNAILVEPSTGNGFVAFAKAAHALGYENIVVMPAGMPEARYKGGELYGTQIIRTSADEYALGMPKMVRQLIDQNADRLKRGEKVYVSPNHPIGESGNITVRAMGAMIIQLYEYYQGPIHALFVSMGNGSSTCALAEPLKMKDRAAAVYVTESFAYGGGYEIFAKMKGLPSYYELFGILPGELMKHFKMYGSVAPIGITLPLQDRAWPIVDYSILCTDEEVLNAYKVVAPSTEMLDRASKLPQWDRLPDEFIEHYGNTSLANIAVAITHLKKSDVGVIMIYDTREKYKDE